MHRSDALHENERYPGWALEPAEEGDNMGLPQTEELSLPATREVSMFERLALDPSVDVAKLEKLIEMQERIMRFDAKSAFNAAYSVMQPEIPEIDEKGRILVKGTLRSTYAKLEDINHVIKPILAAHGFSIRHRTEWPEGSKVIRIIGILGHKQGHSEESTFEAPADKSEFRTDIQSQGSTVSYGRRYTIIDLLNISTRGQDKDGSTSGRPQPPNGYDNWFDDLRSVAAEGQKPFGSAWSKSSAEFKNFALQHDKQALDALKVAALKVGAA